MNSAVRQSLQILSLVIVGFMLKQIGLIRSGDSQVIARLIINTTGMVSLSILSGLIVLPLLLSIY